MEKNERKEFDLNKNEQSIFDVFENEIQNYKLETLAKKIKFEMYRPKQKIFYY